MSCDPRHGCLTCGDVGVDMRVVGVTGDGLAACEDESGECRQVEIALVGAVAPGDHVLVHADVALTKLGVPA